VIAVCGCIFAEFPPDEDVICVTCWTYGVTIGASINWTCWGKTLFGCCCILLWEAWVVVCEIVGFWLASKSYCCLIILWIYYGEKFIVCPELLLVVVVVVVVVWDLRAYCLAA
jgi:hypothetical protein